jgi:hypothetical protein
MRNKSASLYATTGRSALGPPLTDLDWKAGSQNWRPDKNEVLRIYPPRMINRAW